jgi:hypothetical protein
MKDKMDKQKGKGSKRNKGTIKIEPGTPESATGVYFEEFQHRLDIVVEGMTALRRELKNHIAELDKRLTGEIELHAIAIRSYAVEIKAPKNKRG